MTASDLTKCISIRLDEQIDEMSGTAPEWIVSLDEIDERGRAVSTRTLGTWGLDENDSETQHTAAVDWAEKEADRRGLPFYQRSGNDTTTPFRRGQ